ncbi:MULTISPECIES: site-specific integrase [unclassified Crossiella]|uniref:tyrosine-type recombinase/integrase n=1 Tax=unclassified Crossiella TaxID=2620835 RepID=UPI001FFEBD1C|nr:MULTISPECIES: site-specific integrase [unclassified Crossiella]MCK2245386.1 site-specific integrase [Crossiella sp. S99.2]MCK2259027.1 site-specific integrase [Crossiella sp. S99.1]
MLFRKLGEDWLNSRTFDDSSREGTEFRLKLRVLPYLGDKEIRAILPSHIQERDRELQKKGLAETYRRTIFANISAIFPAAIDDERITKNPCNAKSVTKPQGEYPKVVPWPEEQVHAARAKLGERYRVMIDAGAGCGLRQGEVFGLSPTDVTKDGQTLRVERQIKIVRGRLVFALSKHRKVREVPLSATGNASIKAYSEKFELLPVTLPWEEPDGKLVTVNLLLYTRERKPIYRHSFNHHVWKPALREAGVKDPKWADGFHALRHFFASLLLDDGISIRALAEFLGHADPAFTLRVCTHLSHPVMSALVVPLIVYSAALRGKRLDHTAGVTRHWRGHEPA